MASKTVDKSEEVLEIDDSHYLYDDLHLSRDTMQDILDFAGYRVVFDDTKKAPHKAVLNGMWQRPILPVSHPTSTFGALKLNFCVRNENRWILQAIVTTMVI